MVTKHHQRLWKMAEQRYNTIDWDLPASREQVDALYNTLPKPQPNESVPDWLNRVVNPASPALFYASSYITRHAAADGKRILSIVMESDDSCFRLTIDQRDSQIHVKIEALGMAMEDYAYRQVLITSSALAGVFYIPLTLDAMAEAETVVLEEQYSCQLLLNPDTRIIINVL
jgi:hypothetical protein